jgi:ornithine carbamoyltransferase
MEVVVARPHGYGLPAPLMERARAVAEQNGGSVRETNDPGEAMVGARVVYAKSWASPELYGDLQAEAIRRRALAGWCVDEHWFEEAAPECRFMHCLPVRRNVVVTDAVLDGPRSVVVQEARNRLWVQMAVLHRLLASADPGRAREAAAAAAELALAMDESE